MIIEWTEPAVLDLESIKDYIARDSEYYASEFIEKIIDTTEKLYDFPEIGRKVPEINIANIREIIFQNYRIIYKLSQETILILAVLHATRNIYNVETGPWEIK